MRSLSLVDMDLSLPPLPCNPDEREPLGKVGSQFSYLLCKHQTFPLLLLKGRCKVRLSAFVVLLAAAMPAVGRCSSQPSVF